MSGGLSGAEIIAVCRNAALMALDEDDTKSLEVSGQPQIRMSHLLQAIQTMERQITPEMLAFYASYRGQGLKA